MLAPGSRPLRKQVLAPRHNPCLTRSNVPLRPWPATVLWRYSRIRLPARQIRHSNLRQFLSVPLAQQNLKPGGKTDVLSITVRNRKLYRPPVPTTSLHVTAHLSNDA